MERFALGIVGPDDELQAASTPTQTASPRALEPIFRTEGESQTRSVKLAAEGKSWDIDDPLSRVVDRICRKKADPEGEPSGYSLCGFAIAR